ncbi:Hypothetical predicted protein, partial [Marmota monax]
EASPGLGVLSPAPLRWPWRCSWGPRTKKVHLVRGAGLPADAEPLREVPEQLRQRTKPPAPACHNRAELPLRLLVPASSTSPAPPPAPPGVVSARVSRGAPFHVSICKTGRNRQEKKVGAQGLELGTGVLEALMRAAES